jgi:hypothetical protein
MAVHFAVRTRCIGIVFRGIKVGAKYHVELIATKLFGKEDEL